MCGCVSAVVWLRILVFLGDFENMLIVWMDGGMDGWMIIGGRRSDLYLYVHVCMYVCMYVHVCV